MLEIGEGRVADAEVVDRESDTQLCQFIEQGKVFGHVVHEHPFRDLQFQSGRWHAARREFTANAFSEVAAAELARRYVHAKVRAVAVPKPAAEIGHGRVQHPRAHAADRPGCLGDRYEAIRRDLAEFGRMPAGKHLGTGNLHAREIQTGLIGHGEFAALDCSRQRILDLQLASRDEIELRVYEPEVVAPCGGDLFDGRMCFPDQCTGGPPGLRKHREAERCPSFDTGIANGGRRADCFEQLVGRVGEIPCFPCELKHEQEVAAARPRDQIAAPEAFFKPPAGGHDQLLHPVLTELGCQ